MTNLDWTVYGEACVSHDPGYVAHCHEAPTDHGRTDAVRNAYEAQTGREYER
jgi:hypothetical protein